MNDADEGATDIDDSPAGAGPDETDASDGDSETAPPRRSAKLDSELRQGSPYTESQVIMPTVKVVAPFAFTYGLFVTFHGGGSPGGGFQGGAIMAAVVFMVAFAFGIEATREWLANAVVVGLAVGGTLVFAGIGLSSLARGGAFLQYDLVPLPLDGIYRITYGMEAVEILGIAAIVSGVLMGLFFLLASGFAAESDETDPDETESDADMSGDPNVAIEGEAAADGGAQ